MRPRRTSTDIRFGKRRIDRSAISILSPANRVRNSLLRLEQQHLELQARSLNRMGMESACDTSRSCAGWPTPQSPRSGGCASSVQLTSNSILELDCGVAASPPVLLGRTTGADSYFLV